MIVYFKKKVRIDHPRNGTNQAGLMQFLSDTYKEAEIEKPTYILQAPKWKGVYLLRLVYYLN
jgi:hypothetical protein